MRGDVRRVDVYDRRSCERRYSGLRCDGGWVGGVLAIGAGERVSCSMGAAGVTAEAAAVLAPLAIRSSYGHRKACRRSDDTRSRGGILYVLIRWVGKEAIARERVDRARRQRFGRRYF